MSPEAAVRNRPLSPAPATLHPGKNATSPAQSGPLQDFPGADIPPSRRATRPRRRRLYRSLDGRLETTKTQRDALHQFSNIYAPFADLYAQVGFLSITLGFVIREVRPR